MGKDSRKNLLLDCPQNTYPLLRSNTDPTTFPFDTSSRSSNDSRLHSLGSSQEVEEFPESPIAIIVSSASIDSTLCHEDKIAKSDHTHPNDQNSPIQEESHSVPFDCNGTLQTEQQKSDSEFMNGMKGIQKLTSQTLSDDFHAPHYFTKENIHPSQETTEIQSNDNVKDCDLVEPLPRYDSSNASTSDLNEDALSYVIAPKLSLRRTSNSYNYGLSNSEVPDSRKQENDDKSVRDVSHTKTLQACRYSFESESTDLKTRGKVRGLTFRSVSDGDKITDSVMKPTITPTVLLTQTLTDLNVHDVKKTKYSRDDSLTNFLSSMLLTPSVTTQISVSEILCKTDPKITLSAPSMPKNKLDYIHKSHSNRISKKTPMKDVVNKPSNRKRRMFRRMSSPLLIDDDVEYVNSEKSNINFTNTSHNANVICGEASDLNLSSENTALKHHAIHTCQSLPAFDNWQFCKSPFRNNESNFRVPGGPAGMEKDHNKNDSVCLKIFCHRKEKLKCKRLRNLSCPVPNQGFDFESYYNNVNNQISKNGNLTTCCFLNKNQRHLSDNRSEAPSSTESSFQNSCAMQLSQFGPKCTVSHKRAVCFSMDEISTPTFLQSSVPFEYKRSYLWNSSPDLRYECCLNSCTLRHARSVSDFPTAYKLCIRSIKCCDGTDSSDDHFPPDPSCCYCYLHCAHHVMIAKNAAPVQISHPQNSSLIANTEIPLHQEGCKKSTLNSPPPIAKSESICPSTEPTVPNKFVCKGEVCVNPPPPPLVQQNFGTGDEAKIKQNEMAYLENARSYVKGRNMVEVERKFRIFSKFLANLSNLSKSISDKDADNKHKSANLPKVDVADKEALTKYLKFSCPVADRKCSTLFGKNIDSLKSTETCNGSVKSTSRTLTKQTGYEGPVYKNIVLLRTDCPEQRIFKPVQFSSSFSLFINGEDQNRKSFPYASKNCYSDEMPFKEVSEKLEDLQKSIQRAKEMRISASKELHLLQELLSVESCENRELNKKIFPLSVAKEESDLTGHGKNDQLLTDLGEKSQREVLEDTTFWQKEIKKIKEQTNQAWQTKLEHMKTHLASQEEEIHRLQNENEHLHRRLIKSRMGGIPNCQHCKSDYNQNGISRIDSAFEDDKEYMKPSISIPRKECDRLEQRLLEEQQRADQLNLMHDQKLIELNKLQIKLSNQTKEMIELEKAYLQLQCHLRRGTSKPVVERICSRTSPFSSKNLCLKPSPPASPQPTNVIWS